MSIKNHELSRENKKRNKIKKSDSMTNRNKQINSAKKRKIPNKKNPKTSKYPKPTTTEISEIKDKEGGTPIFKDPNTNQIKPITGKVYNLPFIISNLRV